MQDEFNFSSDNKAILVTLYSEKTDHYESLKKCEESLDELASLSETLGLEVQTRFIQIRSQIDPATFIGRGKLEEIKDFATQTKSSILIFDVELSGAQVKNINNLSKLQTIDRCQLILEIFAKHAQTKEAKIQIEISRLNYLLPRLTSYWSHFSRQKGGMSTVGGEGEKQLELDKRIIKNKIKHYNKVLEGIKNTRLQQKKKRQGQIITAALVGYTNVGKSSLMNKLCRQNLLVEDKLFATLDSTYRLLNPESRPPMVLIDTVGLIANLPHQLVKGFRTTLESALEADLLLIVCDLSSANTEHQLETTFRVLEEIEAKDQERIIVFNKKDKNNDMLKEKILRKNYPQSFFVSIYNDEDMDYLRKEILQLFLSKQNRYDLFIPYQAGEEHSKVEAQTNILNKVCHQDGIYYRIAIPEQIFGHLNMKNFILSPEQVSKREVPH